jgi:hypothetical protein
MKLAGGGQRGRGARGPVIPEPLSRNARDRAGCDRVAALPRGAIARRVISIGRRALLMRRRSAVTDVSRLRERCRFVRARELLPHQGQVEREERQGKPCDAAHAGWKGNPGLRSGGHLPAFLGADPTGLRAPGHRLVAIAQGPGSEPTATGVRRKVRRTLVIARSLAAGTCGASARRERSTPGSFPRRAPPRLNRIGTRPSPQHLPQPRRG